MNNKCHSYVPFWDLTPAQYDGLREDQSAAVGSLIAPLNNSVQPRDINHDQSITV